ncbi:MAG TPA: hypothetical protein VKU60_21040, partial [Chloroflexota bacterium]|nr:hypothetical protein [Chloroflexota bacterium]
MLAGGVFVFFVVALVIGLGALQQYFFQPRSPLARVNGDVIQQQWYDKNLAYNQFVLQHQVNDIRNQYQALVANVQANAAATATANPQAASTPEAAATSNPTPAQPSPTTAGTPNPEATDTPAGTPTATLTATPTFNPEQSATVSSLVNQFSEDQTTLNAIDQNTIDDLINADLMRQNASKFGINVSSDDVSAQAKMTTDQIGGDAVLKQLFQTAHLSQDDFNQIQY